ncbi:MAG: ammonium transporter [Ilumatobacteraceae bacterium]
MDSGSLTWVLTSAALVLFMTPGLAFFSGGMDGSRNVLNMLMMNFYCVLIVPVMWVAFGYSLAQVPFGNDFIGSFHAFFLQDITQVGDGSALAIVSFLGMFAAITPALISGAVAGRMKFSAWAVFVPIWFVIVYIPVFKWVYGGWLAQRGSLDFAGGTAIHVTAGIAALAAVLVLGKRKVDPHPPHSMPLVMIGTGILWFGWFGFNAGSAAASNGQTAQAFLNTFIAAAAGGLAWVSVEWIRDGHPTNLGAASGIVAGLVAITPGAGFVSGPGPMAIGAIAGIVCCYAVRLKSKFGYDDALDVVGVHFVGGLVGSLCVGLFASPDFFTKVVVEDGVTTVVPFFRGEGLFYGGGLHLFGEQALANLVAIVWSFTLTLGLMLALKRTIGVRVDRELEATGLDLGLHGETAYHSAGIG